MRHFPGNISPASQSPNLLDGLAPDPARTFTPSNRLLHRSPPQTDSFHFGGVCHASRGLEVCQEL